MKRPANGSPGKAFADGYAKGKAESADTIRQLKAALDKALAENPAMRPAPEGHLTAIAGETSDDGGEVTDQIAEHVAEASKNLYRFTLSREFATPTEDPTA